MKKLEQYLSQTLEKSSIKTYLYEIKKYRTLNPKSAEYTYKNVMQYVQQLRQLYAPSTVERIVFAIKKYYDYLIETNQRKDNPVRAIKLRDAKDKPIQLQDLFSETELQNLLKPRHERYKSQTKTNQIIISLLIHQALKPGEIILLKTTDINLEKAQINITGTPQTNARILPLKADQILFFHLYLEQIKDKNKDNYFLINKLKNPITTDDINYLISTYQKAPFGGLGAKKLTTITIRQSVITNLLSAGNDLRMVQEFAGHKLLDTTEKYKQTGIKALQTAIEKGHPIQ